MLLKQFYYFLFLNKIPGKLRNNFKRFAAIIAILRRKVEMKMQKNKTKTIRSILHY